MLKIAVCIKQVPERSEGSMDPKTGVIIRSGLKAVTNVYDLSGIETGLRIKEAAGDGVVHVFTMGPVSAKESIKEAYAMGADEGYLLNDKLFAGADVLATSYTLMQGISSVDDYDIIICGKQTTDGDTAQVGGALSEWMNIPYISMVTGIEDIKNDSITISQELDNERLEIRVKFPCLISVERNIYTPRLPTLKLKMESKKKEIHHLGIESLNDQQQDHYGQKGSATKVVKIYPVQRADYRELIREDGQNAAKEIFQIIQEVGYV